MDDGGIDAAFVHQDNDLLWREVRHLSMREIAWQSGSPKVNLSVDDLHRMLSHHPWPVAVGRRGGMQSAKSVEAFHFGSGGVWPAAGT
jgi:hypothetical protein